MRFPFALAVHLISFFACSTSCSSEDKPSKEGSESEPASKDEDAGKEKKLELPDASKACLRMYPATADLGQGMDIEGIRSQCKNVVKNHELCTPEVWISLEAAVCIARSAGLPVAQNWRARLWISNFAPHRISWRIQVDGDEDVFRTVDARSGKLLAYPVFDDLTPLGTMPE